MTASVQSSLNKVEHANLIRRRFVTEKYKQFSHQTRPFITMASAALLLVLGWLHIVNFVVIAWILAVFVLDNIALTPIMSALRAINHIAYGRKKFKSWVMLTVVALALISGTALGYFVLMHVSLVTGVFANYLALTGCSPFIISMGAMLGAAFAHSTHKVSLFFGVFIGGCIASILPLSVPIVFEVVYFSAVAIAFFATVIAKQSLRLYYKIQYGHTNADGYGIAKSPIEKHDFEVAQAEKFQVSHSDFVRLTRECQDRITSIKANASFWSECTNDRSKTTNSYKDIYFGLMDPNISEADIQELKFVIANSNLPPESNTPENKQVVYNLTMLGTFFSPNVDARMLAHQYRINDNGLLDPSLLSPFRVEP